MNERQREKHQPCHHARRNGGRCTRPATDRPCAQKEKNLQIRRVVPVTEVPLYNLTSNTTRTLLPYARPYATTDTTTVTHWPSPEFRLCRTQISFANEIWVAVTQISRIYAEMPPIFHVAKKSCEYCERNSGLVVLGWRDARLGPGTTGLAQVTQSSLWHTLRCV